MELLIKKTCNPLKVRTLNLFVASVFLYNSELWGMSKTTSDRIDSFHRRLLRYTLNMKWPKQVSNDRIYELTKCEKWSKTIKRRRLNFLGHVMRLNENTPVRIALREALNPAGKKRERAKFTWLKTIFEDLKLGGIELNLNRPESVLQGLTKYHRRFKTVGEYY